ncbi:MAG TPA: helix-turn-helix transcriptional regulator [Nocardioidaceae bacterium]|nr:helix-turn-helix transcriptional regulator [Nocardioidaceae bacterium]
MVDKPDGSSSPLSLLGLLPGDEETYLSLLRASKTSRLHLTEVTGLTPAELDEVLQRFEAVGLVRQEDGTVATESPADLLGRLIAGETERLHRDADRVDALRNLLPALLAEQFTAPPPQGGGFVNVRAVDGGDVAQLIRTLAEESTGDLLWFRPDQWRLPVTAEVDGLVRDLVASGRRSRVIYPARVLEDAPDVVRSRAEAGESVRIVASVPTRISIFGNNVALMSDRWGASSGRRLVVSEHSLVGALRALFEHVWERGMSVPGMGGGVEDDPNGRQRLLLQQLANGAKDEQIARALGVSLRTVRRRVAETMEDLGAESRFQAGAEAVRRGWL